MRRERQSARAGSAAVSNDGWSRCGWRGPRHLGFKVGAHFGVIVASRLGGGSYHHITATGDTVNVASRLMEVAASHGADLALSNDLPARRVERARWSDRVCLRGLTKRGFGAVPA